MGKGRKRRKVAREANGRAQRACADERRQEAVEPGTAKRKQWVAAHMAMDHRAGFSLGRARLLGMISETQYRAGAELEACETLYRVSMGLPRHEPAAVNMDGIIRAGGRDFTDDEARTIRKRRDLRMKAVQREGRFCWDVVSAVVFLDRPVTDANLHILRHALTTLAKLSRRAGERVLAWRADGSIPKLSADFWAASPQADVAA